MNRSLRLFLFRGLLTFGVLILLAGPFQNCGNLSNAGAPVTLDSTLPFAYSTFILEDRPMGYWKLDEAGGLVATDSSGNHNDGNYVGTPSFGTQGALSSLENAITLNGGNYVLLPNLNLTSGTVELWIKPSSVTGDIRIFSQLSGVVAQPGDAAINQVSGETGSIWGWDGAVWRRLSANNSLSPGQWYHLVFVFSAGTGTLFINGIQQLTITAGFSFSGVQMGIGENFLNANGLRFLGSMDEVAIYPQPLSASRILTHFNAHAN